MNGFGQKFLGNFFLAVFVFGFLGVMFFATPRPVAAQNPDVVSTLTAIEAKKEVNQRFGKILTAGAVQAIWSGLNYFTQRIAYDTAVWAASGGDGQKPLFVTQGWGAYVEATAKDSIATTIGSFSEGVNTLAKNAGLPGFDLCRPSLSVILKIQLGLARAVEPPQPKCTWNQISQSWGSFTDSFSVKGRGGDFWRNVGVQFEPGQSPLAATLEVNRQAAQQSEKDKADADATYKKAAGFLGKYTLLGKQETTPATLVAKQIEDTTINRPKELTYINLLGALVNTDAWIGLARGAYATFTNTFVTQMLAKIMGGFFSIGDLLNTGNIELVKPEGQQTGGIAGARRTYASLQTVNLQQVDNYNALASFTSCPDPRGPDNCVLDDQFAAGIRQADANRPLTIREALDQNLIHGEWPLIPPEDAAKNQDPNCYTFAYCYSNLIKLRKARVISVGWEMAAQLSQRGTPTSLKEVVDGFDRCDPQTKSIVTDDPQSPYRFCHLIDPNWVLKYPRTQCRAFVPGPTLISREGDSRAEVCADAASCVQEDDQGNCQSWGYCTREQNVWRFDGDACPAYYNTCQAFAGSEGSTLAVRTNTVDFGVCNANNAGCRWLSTAQNYVDSIGDKICIGGTNNGNSCINDDGCAGDVCVPDEAPFVTTPRPDTLVWQEASRVYLNRQAAQCDIQNAGCTELIPKKGANATATLNLVRNSSFEENTDAVAALPDFWTGDSITYSTDFSQGAVGSGSAVRLDDQNLYQKARIEPGQFYTLSFHAKRANGGTPEAMFRIRLLKDSTNDITSDVRNFFTTCQTPSAMHVEQRVAVTDIYTRYSCTFTTPPDAHIAFMRLWGSAPADGIWIDAVQLEESEVMTPYGEGYNGHLSSNEVCTDPALGCTYLKAPSPVCTGSVNDPAICDQYAARCSSQDVGCEMYTPTNGDPAIPGIARQSDVCPAQCAGYQTYREEPTAFNPAGQFPLYFIASSARQCNSLNAGCDEFTQLGAGAGVETKQYYNALRICEEETEPNDTGTFYTWEGSAATGFQLRTWRLKNSDIDVTVGTTDPTGGRPPCTVYNAADRSCNEAGRTIPDNCNERVDIFTNSDCREFYDAAGHIHYRSLSRTIAKAESCTEFRKTPAGDQNETACRTSHGRWDAATRQCFYRIVPAESRLCPRTENGCRLYTGNAGRNVQEIRRVTFEGADALAGWTNGSLSTESLVNGEHSITNLTGTTTRTTGVDYALPGSDISGKTIFVEFWAKGVINTPLDVRFGSAPAPARARFSNPDTDVATATATLGGDWQFYTLGPVRVDWTVPVPPATDTLHIGITGAPLSAFVIDNVVIKAVSQNVPLIRESWEIPAVCNATPEGAYSAQEMLGCQEYRNRAGDPIHLKSFSRLCAEKAVGCQAFFTTQNSTSPYAKTWNYICIRKDRLSGPCYVDPDGNGAAGGAASVASPVKVCDIAPGRDRCTFSWEGELVDPIVQVAGAPQLYSAAIPLRFIDNTASDQDPDGAGPIPAGPIGGTLPFFYDESLTVVAGDTTIYAVDAPDKRCTPDAKGCSLVGAPKFNQSLTTVTAYDDVARVNAPDTYEATLCTQETLFCEAWRTPDGSEYYFKDPLDKQCEYKESGPGGTFGWFKKGTQTCTLAGAASCSTVGGCACSAGGKVRCTVDVTKRDCAYQEECYASFQIGGRENGIWTNRSVCSLTDAPAEDPDTNCNVSGGCPCPGTDAGGAPAVGRAVQCTVIQGQPSCLPYQGWAGACANEFAACTEFIDPADISAERPAGETYDFIKNAKLDESSKPVSEQCGGSVSLKEGCVLFNDTSKGALTLNSGATYLKSAKQNFGKVAPVSCAAPAGGDAQYCRVCVETGTTNVVINTFGTPTYCVSNTDCPSGSSCPNTQNVPNARAPASDVNFLLKVRRDRECSRWLGCSSPEPVFDERTGTQRNVCSQLAEYVRPSSEVRIADPSIGMPPLEETPAVVFSADRYSRRGVGWQDEDYSGYTIPGLLPLGALRVVNVGACVVSPPDRTVASVMIPEDLSFGDGESRVVAGSPFVCNQENDNPSIARTFDDNCAAGVCVPHFRLGRDVGPCDDLQGSACTVGRCLTSATGRTYTFGSLCGSNADCAGETCREGTDCPGGLGTAHCSASAGFVGRGACYNNRCMQDLKGGALAVTESPTNDAPTVPAPSCRGYPEPNAPFPNSLLVSVGDGGFTPRFGFQNAKFCDGDATCECNYQRIGYDGGETRYRSLGDHGPAKVCESGSHRGENCTDDAFCNDGASIAVARCVDRTRSDRLLGLTGFCLEPDRSTNVWGDATRYACSTWLPIDRIPGTPDLYNQFADAGFNVPPGQEWYCAQGSWENPPTALAYPILSISYSVVQQNSHLFFGEPAHTPCNPQASNWESEDSGTPTLTGCISGTKTNGTIVPHRHGGARNCVDEMGGAWCIWPQRKCPLSLWSPTSVAHGSTPPRAGVVGTVNGEEICTGRDNDSGPMGVTNLLGCYEISSGNGDIPDDDWPTIRDATGIGTIRYPWIGPPLYFYQIREFEVALEGTDELTMNGSVIFTPPNNCRNRTGESGDSFGNRVFQVAVSATKTTATFDNAGFEAGDGTSIVMYPVWDRYENGAPRNDSRLVAMTIVADDDDGDAAQFFINRFTIRFWPSCYSLARVGGATGGAHPAPFTDRLLRVWANSTNELGYTTDTEHNPWGAACISPSATTLVVNQMRITTVEGEEVVEERPIEGNACVTHQTDALYRDMATPTSRASLGQLFARSNTVQSYRARAASGSIAEGGECVGGALAGNACSSDTDCRYTGICMQVCNAGANEGMPCTSDAQCRTVHNVCLGPRDGESGGRRCYRCSNFGQTGAAGDPSWPPRYRPDTASLRWFGCYPAADLPASCSTDANCGGDGILGDGARCGFTSFGDALPKQCRGGNAAGIACNADADCANSTATCRAVNVISNSPPGVTEEDRDSFYTYTNDVSPGTQWDVTETADLGVANAPRVYAAGDENGQCNADGTCECGTDRECQDVDRGVLVNGVKEGDLSGAGQYRATAKFFMKASSNRMPITEVTVDWGDGEPVPRPGLFKNHVPNCGSSEEFGFTSAACDRLPVVVQHDYRCTNAVRARLPACEGGRPPHVAGYTMGNSDDGGCQMQIGGAEVCVFVPRVHVKDNWGWCTGTCAENPGGSGCYNGSVNNVSVTSRLNECDATLYPNEFSPNKDPWQYFAGRIIVQPLQ